MILYENNIYISQSFPYDSNGGRENLLIKESLKKARNVNCVMMEFRNQHNQFNNNIIYVISLIN